ncbi:MAG: cytochrome P460 family protein [Spirochaetales bacterium]|nr:cytochrome P460 family protein [Spirochaetales bacterium]
MKQVIMMMLLLNTLLSCSGQKPGEMLPEDYTNWEKLTATELNYPIPGHGTNLRIPYINDTGRNVNISVVNNKKTHEYPPGTIIIKEIYDSNEISPGDKPVMLTAMIKDPGNSKARGEWVWIIKNTATGEETINTDGFCITCHDDANENHPYGAGNPDSEFRDCVFFPYKK